MVLAFRPEELKGWLAIWCKSLDLELLLAMAFVVRSRSTWTA